MMADFKEFYSRLNRSFSDADKAGDAGSYRRLATIFKEFEENLREHIQEVTKNQINGVIKKLESGERITSEELQYIRLWIVGDAEYYTKTENNFRDWLSELKRLVSEINKINDPQPNFEVAAKLRAILQDGIRLLPSIIFFLEQKARVSNFNEATAELDREEKELLVKLLKNKLASKEF